MEKVADMPVNIVNIPPVVEKMEADSSEVKDPVISTSVSGSSDNALQPWLFPENYSFKIGSLERQNTPTESQLKPIQVTQPDSPKVLEDITINPSQNVRVKTPIDQSTVEMVPVESLKSGPSTLGKQSPRSSNKRKLPEGEMQPDAKKMAKSDNKSTKIPARSGPSKADDTKVEDKKAPSPAKTPRAKRKLSEKDSEAPGKKTAATDNKTTKIPAKKAPNPPSKPPSARGKSQEVQTATIQPKPAKKDLKASSSNATKPAAVKPRVPAKKTETTTRAKAPSETSKKSNAKETRPSSSKTKSPKTSNAKEASSSRPSSSKAKSPKKAPPKKADKADKKPSRKK